jgi:hypothetical protein
MRSSALSLLVALAFALPAGAGHCEAYSTTQPDVDVAGVYYVDEDCLDGCSVEILFSIWIYEESNGIPGLQRGDEHTDDTCHGMIEADRVAF